MSDVKKMRAKEAEDDIYNNYEDNEPSSFVGSVQKALGIEPIKRDGPTVNRDIDPEKAKALRKGIGFR